MTNLLGRRVSVVATLVEVRGTPDEVAALLVFVRVDWVVRGDKNGVAERTAKGLRDQLAFVRAALGCVGGCVREG